MRIRALKEIFYTLIAAVSLWLAPPCADAAHYEEAGRHARGLHAITLNHGLSDLLVNVIYEDAKGYVWFGTESSVDRFDGNRILRFPVEGDKKRSRRVLALEESADGSLFVGTSQGLFVLKPGATELDRLFPEKITVPVTSFARGDNSLLYIGTHNGLYIYNTKNGKLDHRMLVEDRLSAENEIVGLEMEPHGQLYILTPRKLWELDLKSGKNISRPINQKNRATHFSKIGDILYIGTEGSGVLSFNTATGRFGNTFKPGNGVVTSLSSTPCGEMVVSTDGEGLYFYSPSDGREMRHFTTSNSSETQLRSNSVYTTMSDSDGRLWIGYYQSGADYTPAEDGIVTGVTPVDMKSGAEISVRAFATDGGRNVVIGTQEGIVLVDKTTNTMRRIEKPEIDSNIIFTAEYADGLFYFGTFHGGMYTLNPATGAVRKADDVVPADATVFKIVADPEGSLWVGTSDGLYVLEKGGRNFSHYTSVNSRLPDGNVYEIFFDSSGRGWICAENGMAIWNGSHIQNTGFPEGFIDGMKIRVIYEDRHHNLYFLPDRGEIWKSDLALTDFGPLTIGAEGRFKQFTAIAEDDDGRLWIGTDEGIVRYGGEDDYMIVNHAGDVINPVFTLSTPLREEDGTLWFGSTTGPQFVDVRLAEEFVRQQASHKPVFTHIFTGGKSISQRLAPEGDAMAIKLGKEEQDIEIGVSDFSYRLPEHIELEYMLEGVDAGWMYADGTKTILYRDLQPGKYLFRIREAGNPATEAHLIIYKGGQISSAWIIAGAIIILGIGLWLYSARRRRLRRNYAEAMKETAADSAPEEESSDAGGRKQAEYRTTRLSDEECRRLYRKLESVMKTDKPYINPELKSKELAAMAGTSAHALSFLFNQYLKKNYYDYVNEYRVAEFKELVKDADMSKYTLSTLAERCGFSSRASFFRHFKALTGMTPAEYLKTLEAP